MEAELRLADGAVTEGLPEDWARRKAIPHPIGKKPLGRNDSRNEQGGDTARVSLRLAAGDGADYEKGLRAGATASGSGASGDSREKSCSQAKNRTKGRRCR